MKILKYRTAAIIYPFLSLECEVVDDNNKKYYPNISVNDEGNPENVNDDCHWCYTKPMDQIGYDGNGNEIDYDKDYENSIAEVDEEILLQMYDFWNRNPVFNDDTTWKEWED